MSLASLTYETALQKLLLQYNEHQARLEGWIKELHERGVALLSSDAMHIQSDGLSFTKSRTAAGLQVAARSFFITAMQLSKEQLMAAIRLARLNIFKQPGVSAVSDKPCAEEGQSGVQSVVPDNAPECVNCYHKTGCDTSPGANATRDTQPKTPVRATTKSRPESLVDILARETEEALQGLTGEDINQNIRDYRRQRAKELKLARQS